MEKFVTRRLSHDQEVRNKLQENLGGYCLGRVVVTNALVLVYDIYEDFHITDETEFAAIDLEVTYVRVCYDRLIHSS